MAVKIRLKRMGSNKNAFYRVVVADSRAPRNGRFIEELGYYDPIKNPKVVKINAERALEWIGNGAKPTATVDRLFRQYHVYEPQVEEESEANEDDEVKEAEQAKKEEEVEAEEENTTEEVEEVTEEQEA